MGEAVNRIPQSKERYFPKLHRFLYSVYGVRLSSNESIPWLARGPGRPTPDVRLWLGTIPAFLEGAQGASGELWYTSPYRDKRGKPQLTIHKVAGGDYFQLIHSDDIQFVFDRHGTEIWSIWAAPYTLQDIIPFLLSVGLGFTLRLRGVPCLHASSVALGDRALALLGPAGAGKSTTAAALGGQTCRVLSDDIVTLREEKGKFLVYPGYPCLRLSQASAEAIRRCSIPLPDAVPSSHKLLVDLRENRDRFDTRPVPLAAIYVLGDRSIERAAPRLETIPEQERLMSLVANTYANRVLDRTMRAQEFETLSRVVARVPVRRIVPHTDPNRLPELCETILEDFQTLSDRSSRC